MTDQKQSARFEFPKMLYDMLEETTADSKTASIVSWMPHGRAFRVHKPDKFEDLVMPKYFRERYRSFQYLLEQWGFQGLRRGRDRGAYYNLNFVRGDRDKIENATKQFMLECMPDYLAPSDEPNFYIGMEQEKQQGSKQEKKKKKKDGKKSDPAPVKEEKPVEKAREKEESKPAPVEEKAIDKGGEKTSDPPPAEATPAAPVDRKRKRGAKDSNSSREPAPESPPSPARSRPSRGSNKPSKSSPRRGPRRAARITTQFMEESVGSSVHDDFSSESSHEFEEPAEEAEEPLEPYLESSSKVRRRSSRNRQQFQYDESERPLPQPKRQKQSARYLEQSPGFSAKPFEDVETNDGDSSDEPIESPSKDSPVLLPPSKPVFSGFTLPLEKLRLVVLNAGEYDGEDPFAIKKRPSSTKKAKVAT